ncbi:glycosyltransferase [Leuconostoc sp. C2]|nr:glycosyltransferase [Leuconostoc sp. C2]AEJ31027.1 Glycosyltransferase, involved in cell wall biogenesis [Leuconostoc sp. C2]
MWKLKKIYYVGAIVCSMIYIVWRGLFTLPWEQSFLELSYGLLLWLSEILSIFTAFVLIWNKKTWKQPQQPDIVSKDIFPDVDILIATHNESASLLYKTINACTFLEYPDKHKIHIYLCDDKNRPEMKELAEQFKINYIGLLENRHAKAGNFNYALKHSQSPLVATFDADMIPYSNFLMATVPYFFKRYATLTRKKVGFVQTPQSFYNEDIFQHNLYANRAIPNEQDFFSREVNVLNSYHDSAIYTGSNTLFLRTAIVAAGGFPTNTLTEDFQLGAQINSCGYDSISTTDPMASGLTPTDAKSIFKQRTRWARGMIQSIKNLHLLSNKGLSWSQKIIYLNGYLYWWSFLGRLLFVFAPILFALFDFRVVNTNFWLLLIFWIPGYGLLTFVKHDLSGNITNQRWGEVQELFFAPYLILPVILETIGIKNNQFKVTQKNGDDSKKDILYAIPHIVILLLTIVSLIKFNYGKFGSEILYGSVITFWLLNNLINAFFAVLLFVGKPKQAVQTFHVSGIVEMSVSKKYQKIELCYLTESTVRIKLSADMSLVPEKSYEMTIITSCYTAHVHAYVQEQYGTNDFLMAIESIDEANERQLLQMLHDGFNKQLPLERNQWLTTFDLLFDNINRRLRILNRIGKGRGK